jgi:hypothetical protein
MNVRICLAVLVAASAAPASAGIVSVSGEIQQLALAPFSVQQGAVESDAHGFAFAERESYVLPVSLQLDISTSGVFNEAVELTPQTIAAGRLLRPVRNGPLQGTLPPPNGRRDCGRH